MDYCKDLPEDRLKIRDVALQLVQEGILQAGLHDCEGNSVEKDSKVMLCCPGCQSAPTGDDKDTTNANMGWRVVDQVLSLTDTAGHTVATPVLFVGIEAPPQNQNPTISGFYGRSAEKVMGDPVRWVRVKLLDGRVGRIPAY